MSACKSKLINYSKMLFRKTYWKMLWERFYLKGKVNNIDSQHKIGKQVNNT